MGRRAHRRGAVYLRRAAEPADHQDGFSWKQRCKGCMRPRRYGEPVDWAAGPRQCPGHSGPDDRGAAGALSVVGRTDGPAQGWRWWTNCRAAGSGSRLSCDQS